MTVPAGPADGREATVPAGPPEGRDAVGATDRAVHEDAERTLRLLLTVPTEVLIDRPVVKVVATSAEGSFCLLPRHLDLATVLVPGLLTFTSADGTEGVVATDHGVLVKVGDDVRVACQRALEASDELEAERAVRERFHASSEREKRARAALARLEGDVVRRLGRLRERYGA